MLQSSAFFFFFGFPSKKWLLLFTEILLFSFIDYTCGLGWFRYCGMLELWGVPILVPPFGKQRYLKAIRLSLRL